MFEKKKSVAMGDAPAVRTYCDPFFSELPRMLKESLCDHFDWGAGTQPVRIVHCCDRALKDETLIILGEAKGKFVLDGFRKFRNLNGLYVADPTKKLKGEDTFWKVDDPDYPDALGRAFVYQDNGTSICYGNQGQYDRMVSGKTVYPK